MQDQVRFLTPVGVKAAYICDEQHDEYVKKGVETSYIKSCFGLQSCFWDVADG